LSAHDHLAPGAGSLHLVPVPLVEAGAAPGQAGAPAQVLPPSTLAVARAARYFLVENARSARAFLKSIGHAQPIASLDIVEIGHEPDAARLDQWLAPLAAAPGRAPLDAVLLSEAGCPGIADPGASLVARAHALGIAVVPWVGPCSILLALMAAGMNGQRFRFVGYLPQDRSALRERLLELQRDAHGGETQICIETPYRNARLFEAILEACDPELRLAVAVELTGSGQSIQSRSVGHWRSVAAATSAQLHRRPAVFLLHGAGARAPARRAASSGRPKTRQHPSP